MLNANVRPITKPIAKNGMRGKLQHIFRNENREAKNESNKINLLGSGSSGAEENHVIVQHKEVINKMVDMKHENETSTSRNPK
jgi:hypothetical protein